METKSQKPSFGPKQTQENFVRRTYDPPREGSPAGRRQGLPCPTDFQTPTERFNPRTLFNGRNTNASRLTAITDLDNCCQ